MILNDSSVGTHPTVDLGCGPLCTFNYDSVVSSLLAVLVTIGVGFWIRSKLKSGEPGRVQAVFEWGYDQLRSLIRTNVSEEALFIIPLALTLFLYILIANWIELLPLAFFPILHGANADLNQTLAMGLIVIAVVQWYSIRVLGWRGYLRRFTKPVELPLPARIAYIPLNVLEELLKPVALSLLLFGNSLAGNAFISGVARQPEAQGRMIPWLFTIVGLVEAMYFINLAFGFVFLGQVH